jgi:4-hydroxy-3-polyprenylbenzoate decarboxylase
MTKQVTLGITGATGIPIAFALLNQLLRHDCIVHLVISNAGIVTTKQETGITLSGNPNQTKKILRSELNLVNDEQLFVYSNQDWFSPIASGSNVSDVMIVCPCSMASLGKISGGIGDDLLIRAADVIMKERKNLILVPRETPLSAIHLENMLKLAKLGVSILPPVPAFYNHPKSIDDIIFTSVSRILDQANINNNLTTRWGT